MLAHPQVMSYGDVLMMDVKQQECGVGARAGRGEQKSGSMRGDARHAAQRRQQDLGEKRQKGLRVPGMGVYAMRLSWCDET